MAMGVGGGAASGLQAAQVAQVGDGAIGPSSTGLALQVIVLGSGGGPMESNVTALLVRSLSSGWRKGSIVAVDAGVHVSAIHKILEKTQPAGLGTTAELALPYVLQTGPFAGLELPHASASANAAHIQRTLVDTYLITHPHLDHCAGFVINTAGLPGSRPKRLAGLPSTIAAFKAHIFNNVIWPNLSDENNGAGLVTYMRLVEGGSPALGDGEGKGYLEITDGLAVKTWGVSHGHCIEKHSHRGSGSSRFGSMDASLSLGPIGIPSPRGVSHLSVAMQQQQSQQQLHPHPQQIPGSLAPSGGRTSSIAGVNAQSGDSVCVYDSSAYFMRDVTTGREVLIFGDVEPDYISLSPRNREVWAEAAPKIATGKLAAIFIECSYDDSQTDDRLFGHLCPRYVDKEMISLAQEVAIERLKTLDQQQVADAVTAGLVGSAPGSASGSEKKKRKREGEDGLSNRRKTSVAHANPPRSEPQHQQVQVHQQVSAEESSVPTPTASTTNEDPVSPKTVKPPAPSRSASTASYHLAADDMIVDSPHLATPTAELTLHDAALSMSTPATPLSMPPLNTHGALRGLKVVIIHVKDKLNDGPDVGQTILAQLLAYEREAKLGCEYVISSPGQDFYF